MWSGKPRQTILMEPVRPLFLLMSIGRKPHDSQTTRRGHSKLPSSPNGLRLSGDGGEADGVRCSRGLGSWRR